MSETIRQAKLYDVPAISRIEEDSFGSPWSAAEITKDVTSKDGNTVKLGVFGMADATRDSFNVTDCDGTELTISSVSATATSAAGRCLQHGSRASTLSLLSASLL